MKAPKFKKDDLIMYEDESYNHGIYFRYKVINVAWDGEWVYELILPWMPESNWFGNVMRAPEKDVIAWEDFLNFEPK